MKRIQKRALALLLAALLVLALTACAPDSQQPQNAKIKNVVLVIGDGMGLEHIAAGEMIAAKDYAFTHWTQVCVNTDSLDEKGMCTKLTDSAASGTAMASGKLTLNKYVGKDPTGADVQTILDVAKEQYGKATGVVTTDKLSGATPSAFSAHAIDRNDNRQILRSQLQSGIDLLCGAANGESAMLRSEIEAAGYLYCDSRSSVADSMTADKAYWQIDNLDSLFTNMPLQDVTVQALDYLDQDEDGFVLIVEQAHVDKQSHSNNFHGVTKCVNNLNETVDAIVAWLGERDDTAIIVTADHETAGLSVSRKPCYSQSYNAVDGTAVYYRWESTEHTKAKVGCFVYGYEPDFAQYPFYSSGSLIKNSDIYEIMVDMLETGK